MTATDVLPPEVVSVDAHAERVMCDGSRAMVDGAVVLDTMNPALGHPAVYYSFGDRRTVVCGYCGRRFEKPAKAP